jgi:hypothetical protein
VLPDATFSTRTLFATGRADKVKASLATDARFSSSSEEYDTSKFMRDAEDKNLSHDIVTSIIITGHDYNWVLLQLNIPSLKP